MNNIKAQLVIDYINKIYETLANTGEVDNSDDIFDLLLEISNVFQKDIPDIQSSILIRTGTELRDANTVIGLLKVYLADNNIKYENVPDKNNVLKRFWIAFIWWFENELVNLDLLQEKYLRWDNWDGGTWYLELDYDYEFI